MEVRNEVIIRRGDVANALLSKGFRIIRLKKDKKYHYCSNFVFENAPNLADAVEEILAKYHLADDDPDIHYPSKRGGYSKDTKVNESDLSA